MPVLRDPQRSGCAIELIALGMFVTLAVQALPRWLFVEVWPALGNSRQWVVDAIGKANAQSLLFLAVALLLLALPSARRSGICIGSTRGKVWRLLGIAVVPVALTAIIYPLLPTPRPFAGAAIGFWLISPAAQELVFLGYLYGRFTERFDNRFSTRLPINGALILAAAFFASWHLANFGRVPMWFFAFQLCYTFVLTIWTGMTRVISGSVLWAIATHMGVNFVVWLAN